MDSRNSSISEFQSPTKMPGHTLGNQLQDFGFNSWKKQQISSSKSFGQESNNDNSIIEQKQPKVLDNQPELALDLETQSIDNENDKQNIPDNEQQQKMDDSDQQNSETDSNPKTLTLIQDELLSRQSVNMSSRISQYNSSVDHESYVSFLSILQSNYEALIKGFQVLFQNMHNYFNEKLNKIQETYLAFFKIKLNQLKAQKTQNNFYKPGNRYMKNQVVYTDCEALVGEIHKIFKKKIQATNNLIANVEECYMKINKQILEVKGRIQNKSKQIFMMDNKIRAIIQEMVDLMVPQNRKIKKKQIDAQIFASSYVRTKYLMTKQKTFLSLISQYLKKCIGYISYVYLEVQPKLNLTVKEILLLYAQGVKLWRPQQTHKIQNHIEKLMKLNSFTQTYKQTIKTFQLCIPQSIISPDTFEKLNMIETSPGQKLHKIIEYLIHQSQSLVYLPCIQVQSKDYMYHSRMKCAVYWKKVNYDKKQQSGSIQKSQQAAVIITSQGYLAIEIIQQEQDSQKIALLKLQQLKFSQKKQDIVVSYKGKGVLGYFLNSNTVLGYLKFQPLEVRNQGKIEEERSILINQFINKIRQVIEIKNQQTKIMRSKLNPINFIKAETNTKQ